MPSWPNRDRFGNTSAIAPGDLDGIETALRTIFAQVGTSTEWTKVLRVLGTLSDDVEGVLTQIELLADVQTSTGASLDELGASVGRPRNGLSDDEYRLAVIARGAALVGDGTIGSVLQVLDILGVGTGATVLEHWPAKISANLVGSLTLTELQVILRGLRDVVADGVGVISVSIGDRPADTIGAATITDPALGDSINVAVTDPGEAAVTVYP